MEAREITSLVAEAVDLLSSQQATPDEASLTRMARIVGQAYDLGCEVTRHERHDGEWDGSCWLCDSERVAAGQVRTMKGWEQA